MEHYVERAKLRYRRDGLLSVPTSFLRLCCRRIGLFPSLVKCRRLIDKLKYGCRATAVPVKTISIDPKDIEYYLLEPPQYRDVYRWFGRIHPGDWDQNSDPIKRSKKFQGVIQRYKNGYEWHETVVFDHMLELIEDGKYPDGCKSIQNVRQRYDKIDKLYHDIKFNGYKSGEKLPSDRGDIADVCVAIGRNGEFHLQGDGVHRVTIARVLNIPEIPAKVSMRHLQWQRTRDAIARGERESGNLSEHPDLQNLTRNGSS